jgi:hypothetical protein
VTGRQTYALGAFAVCFGTLALFAGERDMALEKLARVTAERDRLLADRPLVDHEALRARESD